ncbi:MAG: hypothetical protein HZA50_02315 [Planctomycetes bacterium]|nr:hypothetical protein [Planctomycetota bacterium]
MENNPDAKTDKNRTASAGESAPSAPPASAPEPDKDAIFIESVRKRLTRGRIIAVVPLIVGAAVIVVMYYALTIFRKFGLDNYLTLTAGLVLGFCMAFIAWAIYTAVLALVGSKAERLMIKYYDLAAGKKSASAAAESGRTGQGDQDGQNTGRNGT